MFRTLFLALGMLALVGCFVPVPSGPGGSYYYRGGYSHTHRWQSRHHDNDRWSDRDFETRPRWRY